VQINEWTCGNEFPVYEVHRQKDFLHANPGAAIPQETRGFNEDTFETFRLRSKEDAPDYRYMPDPNLGTLTLSQVSGSMSVQQVSHSGY